MDTEPKKINFPNTLETKITYRGRIFNIVEDTVQVTPDKTKIFEKARRAPGTRLIIMRDKKILITREYRSEANEGKGGYDLRLPGGKVFDTRDEFNTAMSNTNFDMQLAAREGALKEAREETGLSPKNIAELGVATCGATVEWDLHYYAVTDFEEGEQTLEDGEDIEVQWMAPSEIFEKMCNGEMGEGRSVMMLLRFLQSKNLI